MPSSHPLLSARPARWPFLVLPALLLAAFWLLDTYQPPGWRDAATPWFSQLRAFWPATRALDGLNASVALPTEAPIASVAVLVITALCTLATMLVTGVPAGLAVAVALGLVATRSLWSTAAPGQDALPVAAVALAVCALTLAVRSRRAVWLTVVVALGVSPAATWLVLPVVWVCHASARRRWICAVGLVGLAIAFQVLALHGAWTQVPCLPPGEWRAAIGEVLRPGSSADASAWLAVRQAGVVLVGDVHLFGIAVAAFGLTRVTPVSRALRAPSLLAVGLAVVAVGTGGLPPAFAAALLLPWWAPWFATGLASLVDLTSGRARRLALAFALVMAALLPPLRHATVVPGPWKSGMPTTADAVSATWQGASVAVADTGLARRLRLAGVATVPADPRTLASCVASGRAVFALGPMIRRVQQLGYYVVERPLRPPLAAVLQDVRSDQLVALALAPGSRVWAGAAGLGALARLGVTRDTAASTAIAVLARTDRGGDVRAGREGIEAAWREGDAVGGRQLLAPVAVTAHTGHARVDSAPLRLATGQTAALAVFDRAHDAVLRGVAEAARDLPIPLTQHTEWSHAQVRGTPQCLAASSAWTALPATMSRLALPIAGAGPGRPAVVLLGADAPPQVMIDGLAIDPMWNASPVTIYDRRSPPDLLRLQEAQRLDDVPSAHALAGRWVARIEVRPRGVWTAPRALITPGVAPAGWLVRLSAAGSRLDNVLVCAVAAGEPVLVGQDSLVDDDTAREITLTSRHGWHPPERVRGAVHQWSARPTATIAFHLDRPRPLLFAMDASGSAGATGRQPLAVRVNGRLIAADWPGDARLPVPTDAVRAGDNSLELSVATVVQAPGDPRPLGVLLRRVRLIQAEGS